MENGKIYGGGIETGVIEKLTNIKLQVFIYTSVDVEAPAPMTHYSEPADRVVPLIYIQQSVPHFWLATHSVEDFSPCKHYEKILDEKLLRYGDRMDEVHDFLNAAGSNVILFVCFNF